MLEKITAEELVGKGVIGMDDSPKLTAEEMQKKFEETAREVIVPKFNRLIEALTGESGAGEVGAADPVTGENVTVQKALESLLKATVHTVVQELTAEQRQIARDNIRALSWETDALEPGQQARARANIGAASTMDTYGTVKYTEQELTAEQRQTARDNIRALSWETDALEPGQQARARANIGAASTIDTYALERDKAPKEHISQTPMYGKGSGMAYGHVLIKDTPDETLDVSKGAAATPKALYNAMKSRVSVEAQELTEEQKKQARANIGAMGDADVDEAVDKAVRHDKAQTLTDAQKETARKNIGAVSWETDVLEPGQQARARANIGAASTMDTYGTVKYTEQKLTGEEKAQAVENIQAVSYRPGQNLGADGRTAARQNIGAVSKAQALTAVEEKYFYEMGEPLVPETTVNCDLANSSGIYYSSISNKGAAIIEMKPETVVVVVNGEQHKLTVQYSHNPDGTVNSAYIGNRSFLGTGYADNGEDYLFSYSATIGAVAVMYSRTSGEKTFSIHVAGNVLADEYLNPLVIKAKPQALTAAMMQQARENIGAVGAKEAIEAVEDEFFEKGLSPIYPEETVTCVATAFNGGTVYKGTLSANGADFYNANYEKVYVKIGGETVKCSVEYRMGDPGSKYAEIGNKHLRLSSAADTGEDFCIDYRLENGPSVIYTRAAGDVTFTVNTPAPVIKQEYLPPMGAADAVTYTAQELTDAQKKQARENIGAAAVGEGGGDAGNITWDDISVTYSDTLTWDGNTSGLPNVHGLYYKVNDATPTYANIANGGYAKVGGEVVNLIPEESVVTPTGVILSDGFIVCPQEAAGKYEDYFGVAFPEAGTYFVKTPEMYVEEVKINGYTFPIKKEIPQNRLPKTKTFYADKNEKVTAQELRYLYIDPLLTVKATMSDVPENLDFIVGVVDAVNDTRIVALMVRPLITYSPLMAAETGYNIVQSLDGTKTISFVTAEFQV